MSKRNTIQLHLINELTESDVCQVHGCPSHETCHSGETDKPADKNDQLSQITTVLHTYLNTVAPPSDTVIKARNTGKEVTTMAAKGRPDFVQ